MTTLYGRPRHTEVQKEKPNDMFRKRLTEINAAPTSVSYSEQRSASFVALNEYCPLLKFVLLCVKYKQTHKWLLHRIYPKINLLNSTQHTYTVASSHEPVLAMCVCVCFHSNKAADFPDVGNVWVCVFISEIGCCMFGSNKTLHARTHTHLRPVLQDHIVLSLVMLGTRRERERGEGGDGMKGFDALDKVFSEEELF